MINVTLLLPNGSLQPHTRRLLDKIGLIQHQSVGGKYGEKAEDGSHRDLRVAMFPFGYYQNKGLDAESLLESWQRLTDHKKVWDSALSVAVIRPQDMPYLMEKHLAHYAIFGGDITAETRACYETVHGMKKPISDVMNNAKPEDFNYNKVCGIGYGRVQIALFSRLDSKNDYDSLSDYFIYMENNGAPSIKLHTEMVYVLYQLTKQSLTGVYKTRPLGIKIGSLYLGGSPLHMLSREEVIELHEKGILIVETNGATEGFVRKIGENPAPGDIGLERVETGSSLKANKERMLAQKVLINSKYWSEATLYCSPVALNNLRGESLEIAQWIEDSMSDYNKEEVSPIPLTETSKETAKG